MARPHIDDGFHFWVTMRDAASGTFLGQWGFSAAIAGVTFSQANVDTWAADLKDCLQDHNIDDQIANDFKFADFVAQSYDEETRADITAVIDLTGGEGGDPLPWNVAAVTSFRTNFAGASYRGRSYLPGITEASAVGNTYHATSRANLLAFWNDLNTRIDSWGPSVGGLTVLSYKNATMTLVTSIAVDDLFATQRRRLDRQRNTA